MTINKLPTIKSYWECAQYIGNKGIRNIISRTRFEQILQNLHFVEYQNDEKLDKVYKVRSVISHFNFSACVSNDSTQSVDKHMFKFKERSSMRQYVKSKETNWGFKFWYRRASKTGYIHQFDLHFGRKESKEEKLGPSVVLALIECLEDTYCTIFFDKQSIPWKNFTELVLLEWIGKKYRKWNQTTRCREMITNISLLTKLLAVNYLINDQSQCCSITFLACNQRQLFNGEWKDQPQKFQPIVQRIWKSIINVWVASTWLTKE